MLTDLVDEVLEADVAVDPPRDDRGRLGASRLAADLVLHVRRHRPQLGRDEPSFHGSHCKVKTKLYFFHQLVIPIDIFFPLKVMVKCYHVIS